MSAQASSAEDKYVIDSGNLNRVLEALARGGFQIIGPTPRDGAIIYDQIASVTDLPQGWSDEQNAGTYRLQKNTTPAYFDFNQGPHSWKKFLHVPSIKLWQANRERNSFDVLEETAASRKMSFLGVRPCDLSAMSIQEGILAKGEYPDHSYIIRRKGLFVIVVNCGRAGGTCFCTSMNTGPRATVGFDLALTEILDSDHHYFLTEVGTKKGAEILEAVPHKVANDDEMRAAENLMARTVSRMKRALETKDIKELLYRNHDSPRWDQVAHRCLTCANCTLVCPTCFCTTVEDSTDITGQQAVRWRNWDSCFTMDFSYIHGGSIRASSKARYRQWMTHKLASWIDQFGTSGCVGCGRCIAWCPAAIDITEEARAIRDSEQGRMATISVKESKNADH